MEKIIILDSNSLLNRAFFALPPLRTSDGIHTNAIHGFMNMLLKLKEEINPDYIVATFDRKAPTFRHKEFSEYKAGRNKMASELSEQFPFMKEILKLLGINICELDGYEADDIIGCLAKYCENKNIEVFVITGDKDALQLASEKTKVILTKKGVSETIIYDKDTFEKEFNITPTQFIDTKGLMGDKSDNIPGVPGIGEKTAFKLIQTYGSIEKVLENIENISGNKIKENLTNFKEQAILSKRLATIITEIPEIEENINLNNVKEINSKNKEELKNLLTKLQMNKIINRIFKNEKNDICNKNEMKSIEFKSIDTLEGFSKVLDFKENYYLDYIIENSNVNSEMKLTNLFINVNSEVYDVNFKLLFEADENKAIKVLNDFMSNENIKKIIHDSKNLITFMNKFNIELKGFIFDTSIAGYILDSSKGKYDLKSLVSFYLDKEVNEIKKDKEEKEDKEIAKFKLTHFLKVNLIYYLKDLHEVLYKNIEKEEMHKLYYEVEHPLIFVLASMESIGFNVDKEKLEKLAEKFKVEIKNTEKEIFELCEEEFNISSPKQLGKILFEKLDLPVVKKTKTGYSTNVEVLEQLKDKHEVIPKIMYYRQITKLNSTYVEGLKNVIDFDGKIHSSFNQTVTTTGRLSSTEPNLQNIPIKYEMGREIRKVFISNEKDDILLSCDYSQIELRVLAHMSEDANMIEAFNNNIDIHTKTASEVFNVSLKNVTSSMRSNAKAVNFGIVYGISDFSLSQDIHITRKDAAEYMSIYFSRYPNIKTYLDKCIKEAKDFGFVVTILNRKRFIPEINSTNKIVSSLGKRLAMNAPIQGSAADIIKLAMVKVFNKLKENNLKSEILLQVHDELILNVKKDELEIVKQIVKEEMESVFEMSVKLEVDINIGSTWYDVK